MAVCPSFNQPFLFVSQLKQNFCSRWRTAHDRLFLIMLTQIICSTTHTLSLKRQIQWRILKLKTLSCCRALFKKWRQTLNVPDGVPVFVSVLPLIFLTKRQDIFLNLTWASTQRCHKTETECKEMWSRSATFCSHEWMCPHIISVMTVQCWWIILL